MVATRLATSSIGGIKATCAVLIAICLYVIIGLVVAYAISLFFSMQTTIYLLLRKSVDGAEMTLIYREEDEEVVGGESSNREGGVGGTV